MKLNEKAGRSHRRRVGKSRASKPVKRPEISSDHVSIDDTDPEQVSLMHMLETLQAHDHACLIYETANEWHAVVIPFVAIGLKRGDKCLYIVDTGTAADISQYLREQGIDVNTVQKSGQLTILNEEEVYFREGSFDPDRMIATLKSETEKAIAEGYPALRVTSEMTWILHSQPGSERFLEYEAKLNRSFFPGYACLAICQYDRRKFDSEFIKSVVMTHPVLIKGNQVYHNFYYIPPEEFLNSKRAELEVQHWLNNLEREQQVREMLRNSEREKSIVVNTITEVIIYQDTGHKIIWANNAAAKSLNLTPEEMKGRYCYQLWHQRELPCEGCPVSMALETGKSQEVEFTSPNGSFDLIRSYPSIGPGGKVNGVISVMMDITESKRAEQALADEATRRRILIEQSRDGIVVLDQEGAVFEANQRFAEMLGYTPEEVLKLHVWDWDTHWPPEHIMEMIHTVNASGDHFETVHSRKDGTIFDVEISTNGAVCAGQKLVFCVCRDIADRKSADKALRESEDKYRRVVENATEAIFIIQDGSLKFVNRGAEELTGYSREELLSHRFADFVHPGDRQMVVDRQFVRLNGSEISGTWPFRIISKPGDTRWMELNVILIDWEGRSATLNFASDITEKKQLEEERQRIDKLESVGTLAGGIAHDFNNILTGILGNISLATSRIKPDDDISDILKEAEKASLRAKGLTQQLLTFARGGAPVKKLMSLAEMIKETANFALLGSNVRCRCSISEDLWHAEIDEGQISQAISNLVINGRQAMPAGGTIDVRAENITLTGEQTLGKRLPLQSGDYVRISVTDHGVGISPQHIDKIFDPYFTTKQAGSGLGLATCYSVVRNHGGHISVESQIGTGSTFHIYLPASQKITEVVTKEDARTPSIAKSRILVMDDEVTVRDIAGRMLKYIGYKEVDFATDGNEAIDLYRKAMKTGSPYAIVIIDLTIPGGMGGEETIKKLMEIDPQVRAIVSSGYADTKIMNEYRKSGFKGVVAKPYTLEQLRKTLFEVAGEVTNMV